MAPDFDSKTYAYHPFQGKVNANIHRRISPAVVSAKSLLIFKAHRQLISPAAHPSLEQTQVNLHLFCFAPPHAGTALCSLALCMSSSASLGAAPQLSDPVISWRQTLHIGT